MLARGRAAGRRIGCAAPAGAAFELPRDGTRRSCVPGRAVIVYATGTPSSTWPHAGRAGVTEPTSSYAGGDAGRQRAPSCSASPATSTTTPCRRCRVGGFVLATASPLDAVRDTIATTRDAAVGRRPGARRARRRAGVAARRAGPAAGPRRDVAGRRDRRRTRCTSGCRCRRRPTRSPSWRATMNGMLGRLESATTTSRRLVSDASHELRTPVAVMRTELEVARRVAGHRTGRPRAEVLLGELDRLQGLVDDLLLLARGDERASSTRDDPLSIVDVVHEVVGPAPAASPSTSACPTVGRPPSPATRPPCGGPSTTSSPTPPATPRRGCASTVEPTDAGVRVHVDDDGPGIPARRRADVVRRFVRLDEGRGRDGGGAGLGLAVTADVARPRRPARDRRLAARRRPRQPRPARVTARMRAHGDRPRADLGARLRDVGLLRRSGRPGRRPCWRSPC